VLIKLNLSLFNRFHVISVVAVSAGNTCHYTNID